MGEVAEMMLNGTLCEGAGEYMQPVNVPWTTIKEIYAAAVKHLGC